MIRQKLQEETSIRVIAQLAAQVGATGGSSLNSAAWDSQAHPYVEEGLALLCVGPNPSLPTSQIVIAQLQDSADNSSWANVSGATATVNALSGSTPQIAEIPFQAGALRRYRRWNTDVAFVGGTAPTVALTILEIVSGARRTPLA